MKEQKIIFETAKLARDKGFTIRQPFRYNKEGNIENSPSIKYNLSKEVVKPDKYQIFAPTQALLQKWIREVHGIHIIIDYLDDVYGFYYKITTIYNNTESDASKGFTTYELTLKEVLYKALKLINEE